MTTIPFDTLEFSRRLKAGGFTPEQAEAMADALSSGAMTELATKTDLAAVRTDLRDLENRLIVKVGAMIAAAITALFAAIKLIH